MSVKSGIEDQLRQLEMWYGDGRDGACPTRDQWRAILEWPEDQPICLINFFKYRAQADYPPEAPEYGNALTGEEAFGKYTAVSMPTLDKVGGTFAHVGLSQGMFVGGAEDWDFIAVVSYPGPGPVMALYTDPDYLQAFRHRTAGLARQKVYVSAG